MNPQAGFKNEGLVFRPYYMQLSFTRILDNPTYFRVVFLFQRLKKDKNRTEVKAVLTTYRAEFVRRAVVDTDVAKEFWRHLNKRYPNARARAHGWGASLTVERLIRKRMAYMAEQAIQVAFRKGKLGDSPEPYFWELADDDRALSL